ncbi:helix-turn-helix domain-containing protein [Streptomyces halstedii]|uniref:helix-turn-helix domain-containing protein n=1 Tax=Streptomyces halstedii TaxID=1944 RepID=UPI0037FA08A5
MSRYRLRGERLAEAAAAKGDMSSYAIAKRTGLNQTTLSRLRRGIAQPATSTLLTLASEYGLSVEDLIEDQAQPGPALNASKPAAAATATGSNEHRTHTA